MNLAQTRFLRLERLLAESARKTPDAPAIHGPEGSLSYGELDGLADELAHILLDAGVGASGRVCIWLEKSVAAVAVMQATLRVGAAYIPLDSLSPLSRIATMLADCQPDLLVTTDERVQALRARHRPEDWPDEDRPGAHDRDGRPPEQTSCLVLDRARVDELLSTIRERRRAEQATAEHDRPSGVHLGERDDSDALAYILYTSGSTGKPKGVCISHGNAWAFIDWAARAIAARADDRFSNHAPFHFDLSVFDLYVAFLVGAQVFLAPTGISYAPTLLVEFMRAHRITVWYSVPSALVMMMESGGLVDTDDGKPRVVVFAGEVFPLPQLVRLRRHWRGVRFFNFYGPTETNVCTAYELPMSERDLVSLRAVPIGTPASGDRIWLETADGRRVPVAEKPAGPAIEVDEEGGEVVGEVVVDGPTVMLGYFGKEPQRGPYRTGDIGRLTRSGLLEFAGRRDHMVKIRGHRVELGEIEAVLHRHPAVAEAAVAVAGEGRHARLIAVVAGAGENRPSLLAFKKLCAQYLPRYMIVDGVRWVPALPRTGNGKIDRDRLLD